MHVCGYVFCIYCSGANNDCSNVRADIVFVVDSTGSIQFANQGTPQDPNPNYTFMRQFMANIIDGFTVGANDVRVGAVTFSNKGVNRFFLNTYTNKADVTAALLNLAYDGGAKTNTSGGLRLMHANQFSTTNGARDYVPKIAILITDGYSTVDDVMTSPEAQAARNKGIKIYAVGITDKATTTYGRQELSLIVSLPQQENKNWFAADDFDALTAIEQPLLMEICNADADPCRLTYSVG